MFHFFLISNFEQMQALAPLVKFTMVSVAKGTFLPMTLVMPRILSKYVLQCTWCIESDSLHAVNLNLYVVYVVHGLYLQ